MDILTQRTDNQTVLKISNNMLKRLSKGTFNELRGKVQTLLASLNSLNNKSGLNKKSIVNNTSFDTYPSDISPGEGGQSAFPPNIKVLYDLFWSNIAFLANPYLQSADPGAAEDPNPVLKKDKFLSILRNFKPILEYFKNNPIEEEEPLVRRFPKYIKDAGLFLFQINEPNFRKTLLLQLKSFLFTAETPLKVSGKSLEQLGEADQKEVKAFDDLLSYMLRSFRPFEDKPRKHLNEVVSRILSNEKDWVKWKEDGCNGFAKSFEGTDVEKFRAGEKMVDDQAVVSLIAEKQRSIRGWLNLDATFDHTTAYSKSNLYVSANPIQPSLGRSFYVLLDIENKAEIDRLNRSEVGLF